MSTRVDRAGAVRAFEDADLKVGQRQRRQFGERLLQRRAQRLVQRVDRAVALAYGDDPLPLDDELDGGLAG